MKPLSLTLENIGPFCGSVTIDFCALGEFFLVSGNTGAGKTTIFDAMTYALYGELPGARRELANQNSVSHFCSI
jgi:exonuclease SbcC